jgi:hypothetical protein
MAGSERHVTGTENQAVALPIEPSFGLPSLAGAIYDTQLKMGTLEDVLLGALWDFYSRSDAENKRFDYYDTSVEWWVKPGTTLIEEEQDVLRVLGFSRCWLCFRETDDGPQTGELFYYLGRPNAD